MVKQPSIIMTALSYIGWIGIIALWAYLFTGIVCSRTRRKRNKWYDSKWSIDSATNTLPITGAYQKRWILSYNEKEAFRKIKETTDEIGCYTLSKVRLLDLLEPVKGNRKYKTYFYKVQAKHVDFVILDERLVARCVIELDDSSHDIADRQERDRFVNEALESVGYTVIHTRAVTEEVQQQIKTAITAQTADSNV